MIDPVLISGFAVGIGKSGIVNIVRDGVVNFPADEAKDISGDELKNKIESLKSDAVLNKQIQTALERAAQHSAYPIGCYTQILSLGRS